MDRAAPGAACPTSTPRLRCLSSQLVQMLDSEHMSHCGMHDNLLSIPARLGQALLRFAVRYPSPHREHALSLLPCVP